MPSSGFNKAVLQRTNMAASKLLTADSLEDKVRLASALSILSIAVSLGESSEAQRLLTLASKLTTVDASK